MNGWNLLGMLILFALALVIFVGCTVPGFLVVTGYKKQNNLLDICLVFGVIFGVNLIAAALGAVVMANRSQLSM